MVEPLRNRRENSGELYTRRPQVEAEITAIKMLQSAELVKNCQKYKGNSGYVSTEALLHVVRHSLGTSFHNSLVVELLKRVNRLVEKAENGDGLGVSMTKTFIRDQVVGGFIERLVADFESYNNSLDYYEINFNHALSRDKKDANSKYWALNNRHTELASEDVDDEVDTFSNANDDSYNPFDADEMDKKIYRLRLDDAIEELPIIQKRIIEMLKQDIPIESNDDSQVSISKMLQKSEKTIRNQRDKAFLTLRKKLQFPGKKQ